MQCIPYSLFVDAQKIEEMGRKGKCLYLLGHSHREIHRNWVVEEDWSSQDLQRECTKNREQRADAMNRNFGLAMAQAA